MAHDYSSIQKAFLDGTELIFNELFTDKVKLYLMDLDSTHIDELYEEATQKVYKEPLEISASVTLSREQGSRTPEAVITGATVKIPSKVLIDLEIPFDTPKDLKVLEQSLIEYKGVTYNVVVARPTTLVGDTFIFVTLTCTENMI